MYIVKDVACREGTRETCRGSRRSRRCTTAPVSTCTLSFHAVDWRLSRTYHPRSQVIPKKGDELLVYHHPSKKKDTATLTPLQKEKVVAFCGVVAVSCGCGAVLVYKHRNNKTAQQMSALSAMMS